MAWSWFEPRIWLFLTPHNPCSCYWPRPAEWTLFWAWYLEDVHSSRRAEARAVWLYPEKKIFAPDNTHSEGNEFKIAKRYTILGDLVTSAASKTEIQNKGSATLASEKTTVEKMDYKAQAIKEIQQVKILFRVLVYFEIFASMNGSTLILISFLRSIMSTIWKCKCKNVLISQIFYPGGPGARGWWFHFRLFYVWAVNIWPSHFKHEDGSQCAWGADNSSWKQSRCRMDTDWKMALTCHHGDLRSEQVGLFQQIFCGMTRCCIH